MEKDLISELSQDIQELGRIELNDATLNIAIFDKMVEENINNRIDFLKNYFDSKKAVYDINSNKMDDQIEDIINRYSVLLNKVAEHYKFRFNNIEIELQEIEANQKIALANFINIITDKIKLENSNKLTRENLIKYQKKIVACINKFNNYNELIDECLIEINICKKEFIEAFDEILEISSEVAMVEKQTKIQMFINKLKFLFVGKARFQENIIRKKTDDLLNIENKLLIEDIEKKDVDFSSTILAMRENINRKFMLDMG